MTSQKEQKYCVIDCRISAPTQNEGESLNTQERICRSIAQAKQATVLRVWKKVVSGRKEERADFDEVLDFIRQSPVKVDYYIVRAIDRFTRRGSTDYDLMC